MDATLSAPLSGIRVADFGQMLAAPLAAMALADLGATVIKFERPQVGDPARRIGHDGSMFAIANRGKKSVAVDLRQPEGRMVARRFISTADVVVESFRPGIMDNWGLGYSSVSRDCPLIVYGSVVGFGSEGPYRDRGGIDAVIQAESGMMSLTGQPDGPPMKVGFQPVDSIAGVALAQGICAALFRRQSAGVGGHVEVRLLDCALYLQAFQVAEYDVSGELPRRLGNSVPHAAPSDLLRTKDGYLMLAAYLPDQWLKLCRVLQVEWMCSDDRFSTNDARVRNRSALIAALEERLAERTTEEWFVTLNQAGLLAGRVREYPNVVADEQVRLNKPLAQTHRPSGVTALSPLLPYVLDGQHSYSSNALPSLADHTIEVLVELGYSATEIGSLADRGIVELGAKPTETNTS